MSLAAALQAASLYASFIRHHRARHPVPGRPGVAASAIEEATRLPHPKNNSGRAGTPERGLSPFRRHRTTMPVLK
jgi:hypothetical protein